jgi:hypothetical protein
MTSLSSFTRLVAASAVLGTLALSAQAASIVKSSGATTPVLTLHELAGFELAQRETVVDLKVGELPTKVSAPIEQPQSRN